MPEEILRPNGIGDECNITSGCVACPNHYSCCNDESDLTYINQQPNGTFARDIYALANSVIGEGTITKITVWIRMNQSYKPSTYCKTAIKTHGEIYESEEFINNVQGAWENHSVEYINNPNTGNPWTWEEINDLQIGGISKRHPSGWGTGYFSEVWIVIDYEEVLESPNLTSRKNYNGYLAFIQQYIRHRINGTTPWKNPDGTLLE
jgi:hypothetical protein